MSKGDQAGRLLRGILVALLFLAVLYIYLSRATPDAPYSEQRFVLDSSVTVTIHDPDKSQRVGATSKGARYAKAAFDEMVRIGRLSDHRRKDSQLGRLNRGDGSAFAELATEQKTMLIRALWMAHLSDGAFDPTVGPLVDLWGIGNRNHLPSEEELGRALARVGHEKVELSVAGREVTGDALGSQDLAIEGLKTTAGGATADGATTDAAATLHKPREVAFDLGGASKGYAVQMGMHKLRTMGVRSAIINAVSSTTVMGAKPDGKPWKVAVENPRPRGGGPDLIAEIELPAGYSISTSGDYQRFFEKNGRRYHHILDPDSGMPASGFISVTVITPQSALDADLLSTAVFVLGPEEGGRLLARMKGTGAVWVTPDGRVSVVGPVARLVSSSAESIFKTTR